jgi:hypothetical protein
VAPFSANTITHWHFVIVSKVVQTEFPLLPLDEQILVRNISPFCLVYIVINYFAEWYTDWKKRGYLAKEAVEKMPAVEERIIELSRELRSYKSQPFEKIK